MDGTLRGDASFRLTRRADRIIMVKLTVTEELLTALRRVALAAITFLTSLLMAVILVLSGLLLEWIIGFSVAPGSQTHNVVSFALDVTLVGCAVVWAVTGAVIVTWEAVVAAKTFLSQVGK